MLSYPLQPGLNADDKAKHCASPSYQKYARKTGVYTFIAHQAMIRSAHRDQWLFAFPWPRQGLANHGLQTKPSLVPSFVQQDKHGFYRWIFTVNLMTGNTKSWTPIKQNVIRKKKNSILLFSRAVLSKKKKKSSVIIIFWILSVKNIWNFVFFHVIWQYLYNFLIFISWLIKPKIFILLLFS